MRVLVCGGRDFNDAARVAKVLGQLHAERSISVLIEGGARGADSCAWLWAHRARVPCEKFPADWRSHGAKAGPIRNQRMIDEGHPDLVVAFPGGRGTADMVSRARKARIPVQIVPPVQTPSERDCDPIHPETGAQA